MALSPTRDPEQAGVGPWIPFTDGESIEHPKTRLLRKHGAPSKDYIYDGLIFWKEHPYLSVPTVSFHWRNNTLMLWVQKDKDFELVTRELDVATCPGLIEALENLKRSLGASAQEMVKPHGFPSYIVASPMTYDIKYFPPMGGSMRMRGFQHDPVPWIGHAEQALALGTSCASG